MKYATSETVDGKESIAKLTAKWQCSEKFVLTQHFFSLIPTLDSGTRLH